MYPRPVVDDLDVLEQIQRRLLARGIRLRVHAFRLHDAHERFHGGVVPRRRDRPLDWQPFPGQISESQARFSELDRAHAAKRRVDSEVVVPVDVVRQLDLQLAGVRERLAVRELGLRHLVGRFVHALS